MIRVCTSFLAVLFLSAGPLSAEGDSKEEAKAAFKQGVEKYHAKDYKSAVAEFRRAHEHYPTWKLYFNIGQCEAALKRYGLALDAFEAYLVAGGDEIPRDRAKLVPAEIDRLIRLVGELEVIAPDGAQVFVDGTLRGTTPLLGPIRISAGLRQLEVKQGTSVLLSQKLKIAGRSKSSINAVIEIQSDTAADTEVNTDTEVDKEPNTVGGLENDLQAVEELQLEDRPTLIPLGWAIGGTGVALLITGAVTGSVAASKYSDLKRVCPNKLCETSADFDLKGQVYSLALATDVLLPLGGALVISGVILTIVGSKREKQTAFGVSPILSADRGGLFVHGEF